MSGPVVTVVPVRNHSRLPAGDEQPLGLETQGRERTMKLANCLGVIGIIGVAALLALPAIAGPGGPENRTVTATCIKVVDGDTIVVNCDKRQMTVELAGIDAPELGQPWGKEVRSFVRHMVEGNQITLEVVEAGETGGTARVLVGGQDLSRLLAERGLAWATAGSGLEELTEKAKSAPCGLWLDAQPVPPWEFREAAA
jgi:endonuclease YncB( thermonuclease family)